MRPGWPTSANSLAKSRAWQASLVQPGVHRRRIEKNRTTGPSQRIAALNLRVPGLIGQFEVGFTISTLVVRLTDCPTPCAASRLGVPHARRLRGVHRHRATPGRSAYLGRRLVHADLATTSREDFRLPGGRKHQVVPDSQVLADSGRRAGRKLAANPARYVLHRSATRTAGRGRDGRLSVQGRQRR